MHLCEFPSANVEEENRRPEKAAAAASKKQKHKQQKRFATRSKAPEYKILQKVNPKRKDKILCFRKRKPQFKQKVSKSRGKYLFCASWKKELLCERASSRKISLYTKCLPNSTAAAWKFHFLANNVKKLAASAVKKSSERYNDSGKMVGQWKVKV